MSYFNCNIYKSKNWNKDLNTKKQTNADKIRNMSDKELAEFFNQFDSICCMCLFQVGCSNMENNRCEKGILQWLQSEVKGSDV